MKRIVILCLTLSMLGSFRAFAQTPNPTAEHNWQTYLARHPGLRQHPEWLNNPTYLKEHPNMSKWLRDHPAVFQQARGQGMWDQGGAWHDPSWWHKHDANAAYTNHPEWADHHRDWHGDNDGDNDDQQHWHARNWWVQHQPDWVKEHHPGWQRARQPEPDHRDRD